MSAKGKEVVEWMNRELPPLSWSLVSITAVKVFFANGVNTTKIDSATVFNAAVLTELSKLIKEKYNKDLPFS